MVVNNPVASRPHSNVSPTCMKCFSPAHLWCTEARALLSLTRPARRAETRPAQRSSGSTPPDRSRRTCGLRSRGPELEATGRRPGFALGGFLAAGAGRLLAAFVFLHQLFFALGHFLEQGVRLKSPFLGLGKHFAFLLLDMMADNFAQHLEFRREFLVSRVHLVQFLDEELGDVVLFFCLIDELFFFHD